MSNQSKIGIAKITDHKNDSKVISEFHDLLNEIMPYLTIKKNARIMIKVNLCLVKGYETGATIDPKLVKYLIEWLLINYDVGKIYIGESDATHLSADIAFKVLGWEEMFSAMPNVELINLSKDDCEAIECDGEYFYCLKMSKTYMESDILISFAKLKTHSDRTMTCILKNQFGACAEKLKVNFHTNFDEATFDINKVKMPDLCLVDGIISMEGSGPVAGTPKQTGLVIAGTDAISTDLTCARLMGINPKRVGHLQFAIKKGLGNPEYDVIYGDIEGLKTKFKTVPFWKSALVRIIKKIS